MPKKIDLTGQRLGKLTVLEPTDQRSNRSKVWRCRCDCGNEIFADTRQLMRGKSSCGCGKKPPDPRGRKPKTLLGLRFGRLVPLKATKERDYKGSIYWLCRCDCGKEVKVSEDQLVHGGYTSCGCRKKEINDGLKDSLTFVDGTCVEWLRARKHRNDNTSGAQGVARRSDGRYVAYIGFKGTRYYLGVYKEYEEAVQIRGEAEKFLHGGFVDAYEKWKQQSDGSPEWEKEHPLIFEVRKGNRSLELLTSDGEKEFVFG